MRVFWAGDLRNVPWKLLGEDKLARALGKPLVVRQVVLVVPQVTLVVRQAPSFIYTCFFFLSFSPFPTLSLSRTLHIFSLFSRDGSSMALDNGGVDGVRPIRRGGC